MGSVNTSDGIAGEEINVKKNILLIISDQHRADIMGFRDQGGCRTPNLDRLAAEGVSFDRAVCAAPLCGPSRATMFSGLYAHQARGVLLPDPLGARGSMYQAEVERDMMINDSSIREEPVLTNLLREEGYHTAYAGKWHLGNDVIEQWFDRCWGYDNRQYFEWLEEHGHPDGWPLHDSEVKTTREPHMSIPHTKVNPIDPGIGNDAWIADIAIGYLRERPKDRPFFTVCGFNGPHPPFKIPEPYYSMYDPAAMPEPENFHPGAGEPECKKNSFYRALWKDHGNEWKSWRRSAAVYRGFVTYVDHQIGRLLASLEEEGVRDDTLVVYVSDHGEMLGQHGLWHKMQAYEEALRVPFILSAPWIEATRRSSAPASLLDVAPTILATAGISPPAAYEGADLTATFGEDGTIQDGTASTKSAPCDRSGGVGEEHGRAPRRYVFSEEEPLGTFHGEVAWRMIAESRFKYIWNDGDTDELYDLESDPGEIHNRIDAPAASETLRTLRRELGAWMERTGDPRFPSFQSETQNAPES